MKTEFHALKVTPKTTWLFVSLSADGLTGWGEATLAGHETDVAALLAPQPDFAALSFATLPEAALSSALLQARADLSARQSGVPLAVHLGGGRDTAVGLYANINRRTIDRSPEGMAESARTALAAGHRAIKIAPFDEMRPGQPRAAMEPGLARIAAVRDAVGDRRLMVDCHWRFDIPDAEAMIDACAPFALHWIECPIAETTDTIPALVRLRARAHGIGTRLAGLETRILRAGFAPFIAAGAYDVMMPDVKYCGGPDEMIALAADMTCAGVQFSPHNPSGPICHAQSLHLCAALPGCDLLEMQFDETPAFDALIAHRLPAPADGTAHLPEGAGLGVSLHPEIMA